MKITTSILSSKVGRRVFLLFICCALIPIMVLAIFSFTQVTGQLERQGQRRLQRSAKAAGMGIIERLQFLDTALRLAAYNLGRRPAAAAMKTSDRSWEFFQGRFKAMAWVGQPDAPVPFYGTMHDTPVLAPERLAQTRQGKTVLWVDRKTDVAPRVLMAISTALKDRGTGFLMGEVNPGYLFGIGTQNTLPPMTELCILDASRKIIASSIRVPATFGDQIGKRAVGPASRRFAWQQDGQRYLASWWTVFLKSTFAAPNWTVVLSQSKSDVLAPVSYFKKVFPLTVMISFLAVLFLSIVQIRRSLVPLERLQQGTLMIGQGIFDVGVQVSSGDEFEALADSFNNMSNKLERQFRTLKTLGEIDRAILSSVDIKRIVQTVLNRTPAVCHCDGVSIGVADARDRDSWDLYGGDRSHDPEVERIRLHPEEAQELRQHQLYFVVNPGRPLPSYVGPLSRQGMQSFLVLPFLIGKQLSGTITLGYREQSEEALNDKLSLADRIHKDTSEAMQLRDQVAVALSNARLVQDLESLNWGTLKALARAVDAKSPWTAGHSGRVTRWALAIADAMRLGEKETKVLHRAGLLHDVGKIGVSAAILDKPAKLTDREYEVIKSHPRLGARILEPIKAYGEVIPIVLQHHEQFGGGGYPDGLAGEEICLGARILAVADVFDALVSDRPYRAGWEESKALDFIKKMAGTQFDPEIVEVFLNRVIAKDKKPVSPVVVQSPAPAVLIGNTP